MVASRLVARLGVVATAICLGASVTIISIGSSKFSALDLRSHGTALLTHPAQIPASLANTLAVTPHR